MKTPIEVVTDEQQRITTSSMPNENGCWIWTAAINSNGYGSIYVGDLHTFAHRAAYAAFCGPIPHGYQVDHLCRVKACCNPEHLEAVTPRENYRRDRQARSVGEYSESCRNGHPRTPESTYTHPASGKRACRICNLHYQNLRNAKLRAANGDRA